MANPDEPRRPVAAASSPVARLDETALLTLWDRGGRLGAADRATAALALALPDRSWAELAEVSLGQRDRLLLGLLGADASSTIEGVFDCPGCGEPMEISLGCQDLLTGDVPGKPEPFEHDGWLIRWRLPNGDDLAAGPTGTATASDLPNTVRSKLIDQIEGWDVMTDIRLDAICPSCAEPQSVDLDVAALVWSEMDMRASAVIREVGLLAHAFGWTESEVLALSPRRRRAYLDLSYG
jgi:hypothetical protein